MKNLFKDIPSSLILTLIFIVTITIFLHFTLNTRNVAPGAEMRKVQPLEEFQDIYQK